MPVLQEGADDPGTMNPFEMIGVFSDLLTGSLDAAASQLTFGEAPGENEPPEIAPTEEPAEIQNIEKGPEPVISFPEASEPTAEPVIPEEAGDVMPKDPERTAVSMEVEAKEFYNLFKRNVKESGRHFVGFEEKAGKNASRIDVDDQISILLHYEKTRDGNLIDRITYRAEYENAKQEENVVTVFSCMVSTLCGELGIDFDEAGSRTAEAAVGGRSAGFRGLLFYALSESDGIKTEMEVKTYYTGN